MKPKHSQWLQLSEEERNRRCRDLNPYEDWELFKAVEAEFVKEFRLSQALRMCSAGWHRGWERAT